MANNSLVVQLLLKTGAFSQDLKTARGQIQSFQNGCKTASGSLDAFGKGLGINIGTITKFGGALGIAALAGEGLKAVIESNQTTSDAFAGVIYSAKNAVHEFATAIGTFDFSNFNNGLSDLIARGREAYQAIDQLGNTLMSYNVIQAKAQAKIAKARNILNDPNSTKEQKEQAQRDMEENLAILKKSSKVVIDDYANSIITELKAHGADISGAGAMGILDRLLELDAQPDRDKYKNNLDKGYEAYLEEVNKIRNKYSKTQVVGTTNYGGTMMGQVPDTSNPQYKKDLAELNEKYKENIAYKVLIDKYGDSALENLGKQRIAMINIEAEQDNMEYSAGKINKKLNSTVKTVKQIKQTTEAINDEQGSLNYWTKMEQDALKHRDALVKNSDEWKHYDSIVKDARKHIEDINGAVEKTGPEEGSLKYWESIVSSTKAYRDSLKMGTDEWREQDELMKVAEQTVKNINDAMNPSAPGPSQGSYLFDKNEIEKSISDITEALRNGISLTDEQIAEYREALKGLEDELDALNTKFGFKGIDKGINKWDEFNRSMSQTATIVNSLSGMFTSFGDSATANILGMVATTLPAMGQLISSVAALTAAEATEAAVAGTTKAVKTASHWIEAIAAVAAIGAAVAAAISQAKSLGQNFANGGIVGGNSYTGDRVQANVNSGEMILNRSQQMKLWKQINNGGGSGNVEFHISGTDLVGVLNNNTKKQRMIR